MEQVRGISCLEKLERLHRKAIRARRRESFEVSLDKTVDETPTRPVQQMQKSQRETERGSTR